MKRILVLLFLVFSIISFSNLREENLRKVFGSSDDCFSLGAGFLTMSLVADGSIDIPEEEAQKILNEFMEIGAGIANEISQEFSEDLSPAGALGVYYTLNCKIPSKSQIKSFGSPTFTELMDNLRESQAKIK